METQPVCVPAHCVCCADSCFSRVASLLLLPYLTTMPCSLLQIQVLCFYDAPSTHTLADALVHNINSNPSARGHLAARSIPLSGYDPEELLVCGQQSECAVIFVLTKTVGGEPLER